MKKKLCLLFLSLLICFGYVNAATANDKVRISTKNPVVVGQHWIQWYKKGATSTYIDYEKDTKVYYGKAAAEAACKRATGSSDPNACVYQTQTLKSKCVTDGVGNLNPQACRSHEVNACRRINNGKKFYCTRLAKSFSSLVECSRNCGTTTCRDKCAIDAEKTTYKIGVKKSVTASGTYEDSIKDSTIWNYVLASGDDAYCIQPGKKGPDGTEYCLNSEMNLNDCDDKLQKHYYCGLAQIIYMTLTPQTDSNGKTTFVKSGNYGHGAVTTALRMWAAYYGSKKGTVISGLDSIGQEQDTDEFDYYSNTKVYLNTANAAVGGYTGSPCATTKSNSNMGILCGDVKNQADINHSYTKSIVLFNKALAMFQGTSSDKFLGGMLTSSENDEEYKLDATKKENGGANLVAKWPTSFVEQYERETTKTYEIECTKEQLLNKDSRCRMYLQVFYYDAQGNKVLVNSNNITVKGDNNKCSKEKCEVEVSGAMTCTDTTYESNRNLDSSTRKYDFEVTLKGYGAVGVIREYRHCANPNGYQIMLTAAIEKVKNEQEPDPSTGTGGTKYTKSVTTDCPCNDDTKCSDFNPVSKTLSGDLGSATCSNNYDGYDKFDKSDPYMNCILNPCKESDKLQFRETEKVGLNKNVCDIYCRKEVTFFLANKKSVYAGMQFRYDIGPAVLACETGLISSTVEETAALTSIVLQKKQCTSEIYYDTKNKYGNNKSWLQQYDEAVKNMLAAYTEWKKYESIYDWQMKDNGGQPQIITGKEKPCAVGSKTCPTTSCNTTTKKLSEVKYLYAWPTQGYNDSGVCGSWSETLSKTPYKGWYASSGSTVGKMFNLGTSNDSYGIRFGKFNCGSNECGTEQCKCGQCYGKDKKKTSGCCPDYDNTTDGKCDAGESTNNEDKTRAKDDNDKYYALYTQKVDAVAQLLYDLQNCNLYDNDGTTSTAIKDYYQSVPSEYNSTYRAKINKAETGSTKNLILEQSVCDDSNSECANMKLEYEDELYGSSVTISKKSDNNKSELLNKTLFCKNRDDNNPNCYKYEKNKANEIEDGDKTEAHQLVKCTGTRTNTRCTTENIQLPVNDYASFVIITETDFWRSDKFSSSAYTGLLGEDAGNGLSTPLGNEVYPVSNGLNTGGKTGNYEVKQHIDNVKIVVDDNVSLDYTCSYDVYNTTNLYDCNTTPENKGKLDLKNCKNRCYKLVAGVPVITEDCNNFDLKDSDSKGYGFVYRNVDLTNMFPNSGLSDPTEDRNNRPIGTNWASDLGTTVRTEIEQKGNEIYSESGDSDGLSNANLKYSFILTPTAINRIREYNTIQELSNKGYQNSNFISCELVKDNKNSSGLNGFYNCKSEFLDEISQPNNSYDVYTVKFCNPGRSGC